MPTALPLVLQLDLIGNNPANRISNEVHTLQAKAVRCLAPLYGGFYTESVIVFDNVTNTQLVKGIDYKCWNVLCVPSGKSGKEICSIIVILNSIINDTVRINYSAVGSFYCKTYETIKNLMDALTLDSRPFSWPNILHRPNSFNPTQHFVNLGEIIGFDYVATVLESIRNTILLGDDVSHDEILAYTDTSVSAYITALNARITSEIVPAAENAAAALTAANTALSQATAIVTANTIAATNASNALVIATAVQTDEQSTAIRAQALITDALGSRSFVRIRPPTDPLVAVTIGTTGPHPLIDYDYFSIDTLGSVQLRGIPEVPANPDIFTVLFQTVRDNTDGTISFNLYITLNDFRTRFYYQEITDSTQLFVANKVVNDGAVNRHVYLSGGNGYYVPTSDIVIYPPRLSNDKHNTLAVTDLNSGLVPVTISNASITHWFSGIDNKTYSIPGVVASDKTPKYGIIGIDDQTNLIDAVDDIDGNISTRIASSLFDFTTDYNTAGYGNVYKRRPVRLRLTPGSVFQISAKLKSVDLSTLVKSIIVPFRKEISIRYTSDWDVHASGGNITGVTDVHIVTSTNPDGGRIRSVSADIDTSIATGSVANLAASTPPAGPTTFIADQFDAFIYIVNTGGTNERIFTITNRSEGNVLIDLISYFDGTTETEIVRHTSRLPAFGFQYSHSLYSFITFPITPLGGGLDVTEYIKWYLSNGQLVTFAINAGINTVTVTTSAAVAPIVYTPVFSSLTLIPSSGVTGSSSTLRATFSGLSPQVVTVVYIDSITDGVGQYHGIFTNTLGVGSYDWTVVVGTGNRDYSVTSLGTTLTATLLVTSSPSFSSLSVTPTNGVSGASATLTALFSNLTPSTTSVITISGAIGVSNGNITVSANSSGDASYTWSVTVGSVDTDFSITALSSTRVCTLTRNYQPAFTSAVFLSPNATSAYDQQIVTLRVNFSAMRPSSSLGIPITLTPTGITGTSGTQTPTVVSNSSGNGYVDFSYTMGTVSGGVSVSSLSTTRSASIINQGPVLYNYFPSADGVLIGTAVSFTAVFNSVPLSGPSIAASILVDGVSTAITIVPNGTGLYSLVVDTYTFYAWSTVHTTSVHYKTITLNTGSSSINDPVPGGGG